jgi:hypothetical protein
MGSCRECCEHQGRLICDFKALGLTILPGMLGRADEVIE